MSRFTITGDVTGLAARLTAVRSKACQGGRPVRILACFEAGLDGHWLQRWLTAQGVICYVLDPASIEVNRRARRANTDRIDLDKLMRVFLAYLRGEPRVCSMHHVPRSKTTRRVKSVHDAGWSMPGYAVVQVDCDRRCDARRCRAVQFPNVLGLWLHSGKQPERVGCVLREAVEM
jgi:transposase